MPIGDPGKEQFRRAFTTMRNLHIAAGIHPLILFRQEYLGNDELQNRSGFDDATQRHFIAHIRHCDIWRRNITINASQESLGNQLAYAVDTDEELEIGDNPFAGDSVQNSTGGKIDLPFALDGSDPNIPLMSEIELASTNAIILLGAMDRVIVQWTRLESRKRTRFITKMDSMRIYGTYQEIAAYLVAFGGEANQIDVAQVLPSEEPLGPSDSPNRRTETSNPTGGN